MCGKDAEGMTNNVDPYQTAPFDLFAQTCLSKNLESRWKEYVCLVQNSLQILAFQTCKKKKVYL